MIRFGVFAGSLLFVSARAGDGRPTLDVRAEGAIADGKTLCTAAIQKTIERCADAGGGTVYFPAGTYVSGTLVLRSHVTLHLDGGAVLLGSADPSHYPHQLSAVRSYTDNYVRQALIYGENLEGVTLEGAGTIDGNGGAFRWKEYRDRPYVIRFVKCQDVRVESLALRASPMWMQHYLACDRVRLHGLRIFNHVSYNNDGIDVDGCHDVMISDCVVDSDDDALCLKSTLDRACENVTITNCVLSSHCNAFKLGTESNGGFKNIAFSNSVILSPRFSESTYGVRRGMGGIALEIVDGGALENVVVNNITISGVTVPIFLRLGHRARPFASEGPPPAVGSFRNVTISNVIATGAGRIGCSITGLADHRVSDVTLSNVSLEFEGGGKRELATKDVPERPEAYPESRMFGELPAYGLYCRHVHGLEISDVRVSTLDPDTRHALVCDDVRDLDVAGFSGPGAPGAAAFMRFTNAVDARVRHSRLQSPLDLFLKLDGDATRRVTLAGNDSAAATRRVETTAGVSAEAVRDRDNPLASRQRQAGLMQLKVES